MDTKDLRAALRVAGEFLDGNKEAFQTGNVEDMLNIESSGATASDTIDLANALVAFGDIIRKK
jgi:hypothetical protein